MKPVTQTGELVLGHIDDNGVCHKEFEMRLPTMGDVDEAIEQAGENATAARLSRYIWSKCLLRIGSITQITPELLGSLADVEFNQFNTAEQLLRKKLLGGKPGPSNGAF